MANPQIENGYTRIANEILDHLAMPGISGSEYRIVIFVLRKTYGFGKKVDQISLSQFQKGTLMQRANIVRTISDLVAKRLLVKEINLYSVNKNWEQWVVAKRLPSSQSDNGGSSQSATKSSSQTATYIRKKERDTKETIPFEDFWILYPRKEKKKEAERFWKSMPLVLQQAAIADVPRRKESDGWKKESGKYVPQPTSYLRGERWTDQIEIVIKKPTSISL